MMSLLRLQRRAAGEAAVAPRALRVGAIQRILNATVPQAAESAAVDGSSRAQERRPIDGGLLTGCRLGVKANICVTGRPATAASKALQGYTAPYDATVVSRLIDAGAEVAAITNMDEFGMGSSSAFSVYGAVKNPYSAPMALIHDVVGEFCHDADSAEKVAAAIDTHFSEAWLTPGGSSGGSAAAVASRCLDAALGSDTGGSVRQPAAFCGAVGFKPSNGALSRWGLIAYASSLDTIGFLASNVGDAALLFDASAGHDPRDDTSLRHPCCSNGGTNGMEQTLEWLLKASADRGLTSSVAYAAVRWGLLAAGQASGGAEAAAAGAARMLQRLDAAARPLPLRGLRVGVPREYIVDELSGGARATLLDAAELLRSAGAAVVPVSLPTTPAALSAYYILASAEAASNLARYDGVRYGHRAAAREQVRQQRPANGSGNAAQRLHDLYTDTRSAGFGAEVQRRLMIGNFALSAGARSRFYGTAQRVRELVVRDFQAAFRPAAAGPGAPGNGGWWASTCPRYGPSGAAAPPGADAINAFLASRSAAGGAMSDPAAGGGGDVDVLLAPASPSPPWLVAAARTQRPADMYLNDVMTVPASLARLPALAVPVSHAPQPAEAAAAFRVAAAAPGVAAAVVAAAAAAAAAGGSNRSAGGCGEPLTEAAFAACVSRAAAAAAVPTGVQLIGRFCDEGTLLAVGAVLEAAAAFVPLPYVSLNKHSR